MSNIKNSILLVENEGKGYNPYRNPDGTFASGPSAMNKESMSKAFKTMTGDEIPEIYGRETSKKLAKVAGEKAASVLEETSKVLHAYDTMGLHDSKELSKLADSNDPFLQQLGTKKGSKMAIDFSREAGNAQSRIDEKLSSEVLANPQSQSGGPKNSVKIEWAIRDYKKLAKDVMDEKDRFLYSATRGKDAVSKEWATQYIEGFAAACQTKAAALEQFIK